MKRKIILILLAFTIAASAFGAYSVKIGDHNGDGKADNFTATSDSTNHLVASQEAGPKSWEGVYVDITTE